MLTFSKKYCYKLIRYFQKNKINIFNSLINRNICSSNNAINLINNIDNLISDLKKYDLYIKDINTFGSNNKNNDELIYAKKVVNKCIIDICNSIIELPNILHSECLIIHDEVINSFNQNLNINLVNRISFNNYVDKYNIRSSNGRVIFMDNDLLDIFNKLANYFIMYNCKNGFHYITGNEFVDKKYLYYAGQMPSLKDSLFQIDENLFCIPTGEIVIFEFISKNLTKIISDTENKFNGLYKLCTYSKCFRNENSHHSKFNKPLIRQSIFNKVETFVFCKTEYENDAFNLLLKNAIGILDSLNMKYRVVDVCAVNMSKTAYKQYDIEVYFPITNNYVEVASCSSCNVYQLCRDSDNINKDLCGKYCTLNCSALPIERILAAYIEYYWDDLNQEFIKLPMLDSNQQPFG